MELSDRLFSLTQILFDEINQRKNSGWLSKEAIPYIKYVIDFETEGGRITRFSKDADDLIRSEFGRSNVNISILINDVMQQLDVDDFSACLDGLSQTYNLSQPEAGSLFRQFIYRLAFQVLEKEDTSDDYRRFIITEFIHSLRQEPDWKIVVWLSGVWVKQSQIELVSDVILRQPTSTDFESIVPLAWVPFNIQDFDETSVMAVLEIKIPEAAHSQTTSEITNFVNLLKLFRLGQITSLKHTVTPSRLTGIDFGTSITSSGLIHPRFIYELKPDDVDVFAQYYRHVKPNLDELAKREGSIGIAFHRFEAALFEGLVEGRIALAINCLEALYLHNEDGELSHRLCQRTAALLRHKVSELGPDIYQKLKRAYTVRSKFVHGVVETKKNKGNKAAHDLTEPTLHYARISIVIFLQLQKMRSKEEILRLIDRSLLDEAAHNELLELIRTCLEIPVG